MHVLSLYLYLVKQIKNYDQNASDFGYFYNCLKDWNGSEYQQLVGIVENVMKQHPNVHVKTVGQMNFVRK